MRTTFLALLMMCALWLEVGVYAGRAIERALRAERPPDCLIEHPPIPEINRVTWKEGERRA